MSTNKRYRLKKHIDSPEGFCRIGTVGKFKNGVHKFDYTNNEGSYMIADDYIKENIKYTPAIHCFFEEAPTEEIKEPEFIIGFDAVCGDFEFADDTRKAVVFTQRGDGKFVVQFQGRPQSDYEKQVEETLQYFKNVPLLCEECGEIGEHKPTCSKSQPPSTQQSKEWEILELKMKDGSIIYKSTYSYPECFQTLVDAKEFQIHSVKRLSDNQVFTIGDEVDLYTKRTITAFELHTDGKLLTVLDGNSRLSEGGEMKSMKKPSSQTQPAQEQKTDRIKEMAIGFFKWNAKVIAEYMAYLRKSDSSLGTNEYEETMNWYETTTLENRYQMYLDHLQNKKP
jgi:hypothetical protein